VAGAGVTLLELAATATPTVAIVLADNQRPNFEALTKAGVALGAGAAGDPDLGAVVEASVERLAGDAALRAALSARGRALGQSLPLQLPQEPPDPEAIHCGPVPPTAVVAIAEPGEGVEVPAIGGHGVPGQLALLGQVVQELPHFRARR